MTESSRPPWEGGSENEPPKPSDPPPSPPPPGDYPPTGAYEPPDGYPPPGTYEPPSYSYPPPGGYGYSPGPGVPPPGYDSNEDKTWALIAHFGGAVGVLFGGVFGWVAPLIVLLVKGPQSLAVRAHAVAALNFQVLWALLSFAGLVLGTCLIFLILPAVLYLIPIVPIIFGIIGGVRANEGQLYRYPLTVGWVK